MDINISSKDNQTLVALSGRLDTLAAQEVSGTLSALEEKAGGTIIIDCKDLEYISSSGLRIFLSLRKAAAARGGDVIVRSINADIRSVFMMTGFLNLFRIED